MDQVKIGKFIARLRKSKNMTQQQLADKIGVSFKTISKWENGRGMPDLSTLKPLSDELGITINELLNGEEIKKEEYLNKLEENMIATIDYSDKKINDNEKKLGIIILIIGFIISLASVSIFSSESSWSSIFSVVGIIVSTIGFSKIIKKLSYNKKILLNSSFLIIFIILFLCLDFINVIINHVPPRFSLLKETGDKIVAYTAPFYNVYRINRNTKNEYYPNFKDISNNNQIDKNNFNKFVENKMNDNKFVSETFKTLFNNQK